MSTALKDEFDLISRRKSHRLAIVEGQTKISYGQLLRWSESISRELERVAGVNGAPIALLLPNSAAFVASFWATARVGGVVAPLNTEYRSRELEFYLSDIRPAAVVVSPNTAQRVQKVIKRLTIDPAVLLVESSQEVERLTPGGRGEISDTIKDNSPLLLLHTSGSTGAPKRVIRTNAQLSAEIKALRELFATGPTDRFLGIAPFSHVNGLTRTMMLCMLSGATLLPVQGFRPNHVLELISKESLTFLGGVPQIFNVLARFHSRGGADLSSLRVAFSSSARLTIQHNLAFHKAYGFFIRQLYGSTETGSISYNDHSDLEGHLESVGKPLRGVTINIQNQDGLTLGEGADGEIVVRSPFATSCYDGNPEASQANFGDGNYLTGDLGVLDSQGYLTLTGRIRLIINRGGYKVNPREVEDVICLHPNVREAAVFGTPTLQGDEAVRCVVVANEPCTEEDIILFCRDQLANYKIPSIVEFRDRLPQTPTGKIKWDAL